MKELILKTEGLMLRQSSGSTRELTTQARERYSKSGEIFMADNTNTEMSDNNSPDSVKSSPDLPSHESSSRETSAKQEKPAKEPSSEQQEQARKAYQREDEGRGLTPKEKQTREEMISRGHGPVGGGADQLDIAAFTDPTLQNIARELNREIGRVGAGKALGPEFIHRQIERVHTLLDNKQVNAQEADNLLGNLNTWMAEVARSAIGEKRLAELIDEIESEAMGSPGRKEKIMKILRSISPHNNSLPPEIIKYALEDNDALDSLVTRIVAGPLDAETSPYQLSFYGGINLEQLKDILKQEKEHETDPSIVSKRGEQYQKVILAQESMSLLHNMNMQIVTGKLDEFISIAAGIVPKHFMYWQKIQGTSEVMRIYEQKYQEYLRRYGRISSTKFDELNKEVKSVLNLQNDNGLLGEEKMAEWELSRALNTGRTFFNITFRSSELIATGRVPVDIEKSKLPKTVEEIQKIIQEKGEDAYRKELAEAEILSKERFSSFPMETSTRMMNWIQYMAYRFTVAEKRGGMLYLDNVKNRFFEFLEEKGTKLGRNDPNRNRITDFGGINVKDLEIGGMFHVTGVYSSWRLENQALTQISITSEGRTVTVRDWLAQHRLEILTAKRRFEAADKKHNVGEKQAAQAELVNVLQPLIDNTNVGLGILLKQDAFSGEVAYLARKVLWEKISQNNIPLLINYLGGLRLEGGDNSILSLENIIGKHNVDWKALENKMLVLHERRMKQETGFKLGPLPASLQLTGGENDLIDSIKAEGKKLAPHLADIAFAYTPFMNDVPFEKFDYAVSGAEYYKRRTGSDLPSYFKGEQAFLSIMNNPGGIGMEEGLKKIYEIVDGIQGPQGTEDAQECVFPMLEAWTDWNTAYPGLGRQALWKSAAEAVRAPTSLAQLYSGHTALSLNETQQRAMLDEAIRIGIINQELLDKLKKKKGLLFFNIILAIMRDYFYVPLVHGTWESVKGIAKSQ